MLCLPQKTEAFQLAEASHEAEWAWPPESDGAPAPPCPPPAPALAPSS